MPKMKTHKGAAKRFKLTGSGKLMRRKRVCGKRIKARKASLRQARKPVQVAKSDIKLLKRLMPGI